MTTTHESCSTHQDAAPEHHRMYIGNSWAILFDSLNIISIPFCIM